jgi:diguanylate cyclase (GGDEF)-like protein
MVSLIGAIFLLGRVVLQRNYALLEREDAEDHVNDVCKILQSQLEDLNLVTNDYAAWDSTYEFMLHPTARYVSSDLSEDIFRTREVHLYMLVDPNFKVILAKPFTDNTRATLAADVAELLVAIKRRSQAEESVVGFLTLTSGPAMVAIRPVLTTRNTGPARGTLIIVRDFGPAELAKLSELASVPVSISGTIGQGADLRRGGELRHTAIETVPLDDNRLLSSTEIRDIWRQPRIRLQIEQNRNIWHRGQETTRNLVIGLVIVGLLFAGANVWLMQQLVVRRVERLIQFTNDTQNTGLNTRIAMRGADEIAQLGRHMNQMLQRLQNSQEKLLSVQERLRFEATHDSLTGIWNRGAALRLLDQELARCTRESSTVAVILADADHFKRINDTYGHASGDRALQAIAAAITRNLRTSDVCCRYGGEEFLVIAIHCNPEQAVQLAQRILNYCRETPVSVMEHSLRVTLSAGVAVSSAASKAEDLVVLADRALYRAKQLGRDRVEWEMAPADSPARNLRFAPTGVQPTT